MDERKPSFDPKIADQKPPQRFETFFEEPYAELKRVLVTLAKDNQEILDLGSNTGNSEAIVDKLASGNHITCVDINAQALQKLKGRKLTRTSVEIIQADANQYLAQAQENSADLIILNATLHEINPPNEQATYLEGLFGQIKRCLRVNGVVLIGDYYYPDMVPDEEVAAYMEQQRREIGHADLREKFVKPDLLAQKASEYGFKTEYANEIQAVKGIDRKYYIYVLRKEEKSD